MTTPTVTLQQISDMKHAIGFDIKRVKDGVYECYRNFFALNQENESWEKLVKIGFANKFDNHINKGGTVYSVSEKGLKHLEQIYEVKCIHSN